MSLLRRRMMMQQDVSTTGLLDIETARKETDSWRNIEYTVSDGAITITKALYTWSSVYVYLDNCIYGKSYRISFKCKTEREIIPDSAINIDGKISVISGKEEMNISFECGTDTPFLHLRFSSYEAQTIPVTYYDFVLEEI